MTYIDPNKAVADHIRTLDESMRKLREIKNALLSRAEVEPDEFKRIVYDKLAQYPIVMRELLKNFEMLALQFKLEGLRDIMYELEEVKRSPAIQKKIQKLFLDCESRWH